MNLVDATIRVGQEILFRVWDFGMKKDNLFIIYYSALLNLYFTYHVGKLGK